MIPILAPILAELAKNGLGILAGAVTAKGKAAVEEKLGVKIPEAGLSAELALQLKSLEFQHEEWLVGQELEGRKLDLEGAKLEGEAVTSRWQSDMASDSWLSKNIRPSVLLYLLSAYTILSLLSAFGFNVNQAYIELLGQWGMLVMTAYFGGRSMEKIFIHRRENSK